MSSQSLTFKTRLTDPLLIVISDDKRWCKSNINRNNTVISPFNTPYADLALMTLCDHVIITSGTVGWWGAWLSNGNVVYYKKTIHVPIAHGKLGSIDMTTILLHGLD